MLPGIKIKLSWCWLGFNRGAHLPNREGEDSNLDLKEGLPSLDVRQVSRFEVSGSARPPLCSVRMCLKSEVFPESSILRRKSWKFSRCEWRISGPELKLSHLERRISCDEWRISRPERGS